VGLKNPPENERDIEKALGKPPDIGALLNSNRLNTFKTSRQELKDEAYLTVDAGAVFYGAIDIMGGFNEGMTALIEKPQLVRSLVEQLALWHCPIVEAGAKAGADGAWLGNAGYEGAELISPEMWREVALPGHRIQVEHAHECGLQVLFWFLGDCMPLLDDLVELGIDGLWLEQGRRGYSSDPGEIRQRVGNAFCVYGWNWELDFIQANYENITREVERQIQHAGRDGAFIMGTTYLTAEADLKAVEHYCHEIVRMSEEVGY
jgi:uroporphyrinogen-III decarboxylase